jgi:hypothetical protein
MNGMPRSLLPAFRGADARSLSKALVLLVAFSGFLGAFHAGGTAGQSNFSAIICNTQGVSADRSQDPTHQREHFCCVFGCTTAAVGVVAKIDPPTLAALGSTLPAKQRAPSSLVVAPARPGDIGPRGPPLSA